MKNRLKRALIISVVLAMAVGMTACGSKSSEENKNNEKKTIKIGSIAYNQDEVLVEPAVEKLKEEGYEVKSLVFENATVMNEAIQEGSLDATLHEHKPFLDAYNESKGTDLVMLKPYVHYRSAIFLPLY